MAKDSVFTISRAAAKAIMVHGAGIKTADKWTDEKLLGKFPKLKDVVDDDTDVGEHQKTLADLLLAVEKGQEIVIVDDAPAKAEKTAKKGKAAKKAEPKPEPEEEEADEEEDSEDDEEAEEEEEEEEPAPKKGKGKKAKKEEVEEEEEEEDEEDEDEDDEEEEESEDDEEDEEDKKAKKAEKKEKPKKAEKEKKPKKDVPRDKFGSKLDSACAKMNACFTNKSKTVDQIAEESGCTKSRVKGHCQYLAKKGLVEKTDKGWKAAAGK